MKDSWFGIHSSLNEIHKKWVFLDKKYLNKYIIYYLIFISIILEILHLIIPNRTFQFDDLFGNIVGVLLSIILINIYNFWRKNEHV